MLSPSWIEEENEGVPMTIQQAGGRRELTIECSTCRESDSGFGVTSCAGPEAPNGMLVSQGHNRGPAEKGRDEKTALWRICDECKPAGKRITAVWDRTARGGILRYLRRSNIPTKVGKNKAEFKVQRNAVEGGVKEARCERTNTHIEDPQRFLESCGKQEAGDQRTKQGCNA